MTLERERRSEKKKFEKRKEAENKTKEKSYGENDLDLTFFPSILKNWEEYGDIIGFLKGDKATTTENRVFEYKIKGKEWGYLVYWMMRKKRRRSKDERMIKMEKKLQKSTMKGLVKSLLERQQRIDFLKPFKSLTKLLYFSLTGLLGP